MSLTESYIAPQLVAQRLGPRQILTHLLDAPRNLPLAMGHRGVGQIRDLSGPSFVPVGSYLLAVVVEAALYM